MERVKQRIVRDIYDVRQRVQEMLANDEIPDTCFIDGNDVISALNQMEILEREINFLRLYIHQELADWCKHEARRENG